MGGGVAEHGEVVFGLLEIAERVAQQRHDVEAPVLEPEFAGVTLAELDRQAFGAGAAAGQADQVARPVDAHNAAIAAPGELQAVPSLPATQVEDVGWWLEAQYPGKMIDLLRGDRVFQDVCIGE